MISIVVALFNRLDRTQPFLESLERHAPPEPWEIIWVDDGSTDGTREWLATLRAPRHHVILNERNLGFAASNNRGAHAANGDVLALLNNDLLLHAGWFTPLHAALAQPDIGVVGNVHLQPTSGLIDHAGVAFDLVGLPDHHDKGVRPPLRGNGRYVAAVSAACWLVRREVFFRHGGFDELYRNGCEDVDLCLQMRAAGLRHWVDYRSVVSHHVSSSPGRKDRETANLRLFLERWSHITLPLGRIDWPRNYLTRYLRQPSRLNATKTCDALLRLAGLRRGDSEWARQRRAAILGASAT